MSQSFSTKPGQAKDEGRTSNREGDQARVELDDRFHRVVLGGVLAHFWEWGRLHRFVGDDPTK